MENGLKEGKGGLWFKSVLEDREGWAGVPPSSGLLITLDGASCSSLRGASRGIFHTPQSHAERRWHFWQSIIASLFLLSNAVASLFLSSHFCPLVRCRRLPGEFSVSSASEGSSARRATKIGLQVGRTLSLSLAESPPNEYLAALS